MTTENEQNQQNQQGNDAKKIEKKFTSSVATLIAIVKGKQNLFPKKLDSSEMDELSEDLFKEEKEALKLGIKTDLKNLVKQYSEFEKLKKQKEEELAKVVTEKMKEFNKAAESIFNRIKGVDAITTAYNSSLEAIVKSGIESPEEGVDEQKEKNV